MIKFFYHIENVKKEIFRKLQNFHAFVQADPHVSNLKLKTEYHFPAVVGHFYKVFYSVSISCITIFILYTSLWRPPLKFPEHSVVTVPKGAHLSEIGEILEEKNIIVSPFWLKVFVIMNGGEKSVIAGDYYFPERVGVIDVSNIIMEGKFGFTPSRVVIFEGLNSYEIADAIAASVPSFDKKEFAAKAKDYEGYLFPDTYFFTPNSTPEDIIALMRENFARKTKTLLPDVEKFGKPFTDVVSVASIVEDEASTINDKRIVAGIIWKRLKLDMPLQTDSTLRYVSGKDSHEITKDELADKSNPYNTYANKGLPPTPISNPGLNSLRAAAAPTNTNYLYFLSDKSGNVHYAQTFEQHKRNRELYLGK